MEEEVESFLRIYRSVEKTSKELKGMIHQLSLRALRSLGFSLIYAVEGSPLAVEDFDDMEKWQQEEFVFSHLKELK